MTDSYLRFVNCLGAWRMHAFALGEGLCGALGVAVDPLPHQLATVRQLLGEARIRHLISDEVGLGKTVQALMVVNALRFQDPDHKTLVVLPGHLLSQWQDECWTKGHVMPALVGASDFDKANLPPITLVRASDLAIRDEEGTRLFQVDSQIFDLIIIDEPQTMPREAIQTISQLADGFRQVLVLSATPRLADVTWRNPLMRILEPELAERARLQDKTIDELLADREACGMAALEDDDNLYPVIHAQYAAGRRIVRNSRRDWSDRLPRRRNHVVRVLPLQHERLRSEIALELVEETDPRAGFEGPLWTTAKSLQRSARAARSVLGDVAERGGELGMIASAARQLTLDDPGDSRLGALLDILADQWSRKPDRKFIIVCGDNPTIEMLLAALPRYFPELDDAISVLRRPSAGEEDRVANLRNMQATLAPLNSGESRLLLVGDWVQAGLNLHQVSSSIIFYSLPWEIDSIDQLIGRIDRLNSGRADRDGQRWVDIWRILVEGSQEAAVADCMDAMGVFESPLPPLSPAHLESVQELLAQAAISGRIPADIPRLVETEKSLTGTFRQDCSGATDEARKLFDVWVQNEGENRPLALDVPGLNPVAKKERAIGSWLKVMSKASDFDVDVRQDKSDSYLFRTFWYARMERNRAGESPFLLPGVGTDRWMADHVPCILRRADMASPPRRSVSTDEGEDTRRPLHFIDNGDSIFDALVAGYRAAAETGFGRDQQTVQTVVMLPEGHPALTVGSNVFLTATLLDPFPDSFIPELWSIPARKLLETAPTEAQRTQLLEDRKALRSHWQAIQRAVRLSTPAQLLLAGAAQSGDGYRKLTREDVEACLQPFATEGKAAARGKAATQPVVSKDLAERWEAEHREQVANVSTEFHATARRQAASGLEIIAVQTAASYSAELRNRELAAERRRASRSEGVPEELWLGQVAALERQCRSLEMCMEEALALIAAYRGGALQIEEPPGISILAGLRTTG